MKTIYKYPLEIADVQTVKLPINAQIIREIHIQNGIPVFYAIVDTEETEKRNVTVSLYGTGHSIPENDKLEHLGTFLMYNDRLVFHVFIDMDCFPIVKH